MAPEAAVYAVLALGETMTETPKEAMRKRWARCTAVERQ